MTYAELKADMIADLTLIELHENQTHKIFIPQFTEEEAPFIAETLTNEEGFPFNVVANGQMLLYQHEKGAQLTTKEVSDLLDEFKPYILNR